MERYRPKFDLVPTKDEMRIAEAHAVALILSLDDPHRCTQSCDVRRVGRLVEHFRGKDRMNCHGSCTSDYAVQVSLSGHRARLLEPASEVLVGEEGLRRFIPTFARQTHGQA